MVKDGYYPEISYCFHMIFDLIDLNIPVLYNIRYPANGKPYLTNDLLHGVHNAKFSLTYKRTFTQYVKPFKGRFSTTRSRALP